MLRESDLVAIIKSHRRDSLGVDDGSLSNERATALDHYHGRPYGNEMEGRSAVVSKDLSEAVDWAIPGIIRVFVQSGNVGEFAPVGPEDEELSQQESDAINHVLMVENNGFMLLHDALKDGLILKNCYAKHWWDVTEKTTTEEYSGLSLEEFTSLLMQLEQSGADVEVVGKDELVEIIQTPAGAAQVQVFDCKLRITRKEGRVVVIPVPVEEIRVSKKCRGELKDSPFVEHVTTKTRSDLIEMGMPKDFVDTLPAFGEKDTDAVPLARDTVSDETDDFGQALIDRSMDEIEYCEAYIRVDYDGDGIAELRKVVTVAERIPPGDEWNEEIDAIPITGGVIKRVPHRHVGESLDDDLADLQEIKTVLMRQMLDNIFATNNNQWILNERANLADFMQSLPGGIKRVRGLEPVSGSVEPMIVPQIMGQIMPAIDYIDGTKESRTGINRATTGLDPDIMKQSTKGAYIENLSRASQKVEMIARIFAETFVKPLLMNVHALMIKHQDKPKIMKLRGKYVQVSPQEWRDRSDLRLKVGLGTGSEEEKREKLGVVVSLQEKLAAFGMVGPVQAFNLFSDMTKAMGFDMPEKYAMAPMSQEFQQVQQQRNQSPSNPLAEVESIKQQAMIQREQMNLEFKQWAEYMNAQLQMANDAADRRSREVIEAAKLEIQALLKPAPVPDMGPVGIGGGLAQ